MGKLEMNVLPKETVTCQELLLETNVSNVSRSREFQENTEIWIFK